MRNDMNKALASERNWYSQEGHVLSPKHRFAHDTVRNRFQEHLRGMGIEDAKVLDIGCGSGQEFPTDYPSIGIDVAKEPLIVYSSYPGKEGILADASHLPFSDESFDFVICSGLLHHLIGQGDLLPIIKEMARVSRRYVAALDPNLFNHSGMLMNVCNTIWPGITGLVPHERALSPLRIERIFRRAELQDVNCVAASFVWNRWPLEVSTFIDSHEATFRKRWPTKYLGWWWIITGKK
jgi:SAM-dependent methyltransferase